MIVYDDLTPAHFAEWGVEDYCPHPSRLLGFACRRDGVLVAIGCVWVDEDERWWGSFGGKPGFPHGIHRKTLELFAALERAGVREIWAEPDAQVPRAREWLERLGFVEAGGALVRRLENKMNQVRKATIEDMPRLMEYADKFLSYHPLTAALPREIEALEATLTRMLSDPATIILIHDHGVIGGIIVPVWCAPSTWVAMELFWWADRNGIKLLRAFEAWAEESGADMVQMLSITGRSSPDAIYERSGYVQSEVSFVRSIR